MRYPYMTLADETEILHSQIIEKDGQKSIIVHFERSTEDRFGSAQCMLPEYRWLEVRGYTKEKVELFDKLLHSNAHLIFKYAANGGVQIA